MRTLIAYSTRHGATRKYAEDLSREIPGEVTLVDLRVDPDCDISPFETVVIGGAVYFGQVQQAVRAFCGKNLAALQRKRLGLFICCWYQGQKAERQLEGAFPGELLKEALVKDFFGGELNLAGMNFVERLITRVIGVSENVSHYSEDAIRRFASSLK